MEANVVKTWSCTKVEIVKVTRTWTICNFSYSGQKTGDALKSETFSAAAEDKVNWCLKLFPRGLKKSEQDYISIFLRLVSSDKAEILAKFKIALYNDKMEECNTVQMHQVFLKGTEYGFRNYVKRDYLSDKRNRLLSDDKLVVFCEVAVARHNVNFAPNEFPLKLKDPASSLCENLELLFDTQKFSDVLITAGGREFQAHKMILAAHSAVFSAMFEHEMEEQKHNRVDIIDIDDKVVEEMLRFMYTGKVPNIKTMADSLLVAADKYALDLLKLMCQELLCESLVIENAVRILILADSHGCDWLKAQALNFINTHTSAVMDTKDFEFVMSSHPHLIVAILRATIATKRNGDADESMSSSDNEEAS